MKNLRAVLISATALGSIFASANAATITVSKLPKSDVVLISVTGGIVDSDADGFRKVAANYSKAIVDFNSPGGKLYAGIDIGTEIRDRGYSTMVRSGVRCNSACAIAWLGGTKRMMDDKSRVGFHSPFDSATREISSTGNAIAGAYFGKLGLSYKTIFFLTATGPNELAWLTKEKAANLGIEVSPIVMPGSAPIVTAWPSDLPLLPLPPRRVQSLQCDPLSRCTLPTPTPRKTPPPAVDPAKGNL